MAYNIPNPLGNLGSFAQPLGDLTAGVTSLQRTEIQRKIQEIEQEKQWNRQDMLRNEDFALKMASTDVINDKRLGIAEEAMKQADDFLTENTNMIKKAQAEGRSLTLPERMKLVIDQKKILSNNAQAAAFTDALEKAQPIHMATMAKLTDPNERDQYNKQWADLYLKMQDKEASKNLSAADIMAAMQPPPPPVYKTFDAVDKEIGLSLKDVKSRDEIKNIVAAKIKPREGSLLPMGQAGGYFGNEQQMVDFFTERVIGYKKEEKAGGSGRGGRTPKYDRYSGDTSQYQSAVIPNKTSNAFVVSDFGTPITASFTPPDAKQPTSAKITPLALRDDGMLEVEATINKEKTSRPMNQDEAVDFKDTVGGKINPAPDGKFVVTYVQQQKYTTEVPYTKDLRAKISGRLPEMDSYFENLGIIRKDQSSIQELEAKYKKQREEKYGVSAEFKPRVNEVQRQTKDGKIAIFDATTKKFLRYAE